jgi:hypothetical protein
MDYSGDDDNVDNAKIGVASQTPYLDVVHCQWRS